VPKFVATSATTAGMINTAPSPSRRDQPNSSTPSEPEIAVVNDPQP